MRAPKTITFNKDAGTVLTKNIIAKVVAKNSGVPVYIAKKMVDNVFISIIQILKEMKSGDKLMVKGFGVWSMHYLPGKTKRHSYLFDKEYSTVGRRRVLWKMSSQLKEDLHIPK